MGGSSSAVGWANSRFVEKPSTTTRLFSSQWVWADSNFSRVKKFIYTNVYFECVGGFSLESSMLHRGILKILYTDPMFLLLGWVLVDLILLVENISSKSVACFLTGLLLGNFLQGLTYLIKKKLFWHILKDFCADFLGRSENFNCRMELWFWGIFWWEGKFHFKERERIIDFDRKEKWF